MASIVVSSSSVKKESPEDSITVEVKTQLDRENKAFRTVTANIVLDSSEIGNIYAVLVNRSRIPNGYFLSEMDEYSGELQQIASIMFDEKKGRTTIESLAKNDDVKRQILYISRFHMNLQYRSDSDSEYCTVALRKFLHHPTIVKQKFSLAIYILDPNEVMSEEEKNEDEQRRRAIESDESNQENACYEREKKRRKYTRMDAYHFLRNGFYQDLPLAKSGGHKILVASHQDIDKPKIASYEEAASVNFYWPPKEPKRNPKDEEIFQTVMKEYRRMGDNVSPDFMTTITNLVNEGGSLARSNALHAACANNCEKIVDCLLSSPDVINSRDLNGCTPLMIAAERAAGRMTINGIQESRVIDKLLAAGADKDLQDSEGMTAYGYFFQRIKELKSSIAAMCGRSCLEEEPKHNTEKVLERKLIPNNGPTPADQGKRDGFVRYDD